MNTNKYGLTLAVLSDTEDSDKRTAKLYRQIVSIRANMWDRCWNLKVHPSALFELHVPPKWWPRCKPMMTVFGGKVTFTYKDYAWWDECLKAMETGVEFREKPPRMKERLHVKKTLD
jgi:hypothetical protein